MATTQVRYQEARCGLTVDMWQSQWPSEFQKRCEFNLRTENERYVEEWAGKTQTEPNPDSSLIRFFMRGSSPSDVCPTETDLIEGFCQDMSLPGLLDSRRDEDEGLLPKVALLDERSCQDGVEYVRANSGPKSARELYHSLLRPVRPKILPPRLCRQTRIHSNWLVQAIPCERFAPGSDR